MRDAHIGRKLHAISPLRIRPRPPCSCPLALSGYSTFSGQSVSQARCQSSPNTIVARVTGSRFITATTKAMRARHPCLCLAGLTRHSGDFERLASHLAPTRRVICPDQRGRGRSQHDANWLNYHPGTYVDDMRTLLRELRLERAIVVGTSLGGVIAMVMASYTSAPACRCRAQRRRT